MAPEYSIRQRLSWRNNFGFGYNHSIKLNLFYPSHDIALANGVRHFNPPAAALRLQEDLASLSDIWNQPFLRGETSIPQPWGWDWDTRRYIHEQYHVPYADLPSDELLGEVKNFSSREKIISLIEYINEHAPSIFASSPLKAPLFLTTEEAVRNYIDEHDRKQLRFVLKTPWSSSGRGLSLSHTKHPDGSLTPTPREVLMRHALATIKKMGGIMAEEWNENKLQDFALLFHATGDEVNFIGFSLFDNDEAAGGTTYRQGYLLSNEVIASRLGIEPSILRQIIDVTNDGLRSLLKPLLGHKWSLGYMGIDMMTYASGDESPSLALLELNLRTTMGTVCRLYYDQHHTDGLFRISPMLEDGHFRAEFLTCE